MKKLLTVASASIITVSCAWFPNMQVAHATRCDEVYAHLLKKYSEYSFENQDNMAPSKRFLAGLETEVLSAIKACPQEKPLLLAMLANIDITQGENDKALEHARLAEELDPSIWETNAALGDVLMLSGDYVNGLPYLEKASRLSPKNIFLRSNLCSNYEMAKRYQKAINVCTEVIESGDRKVSGPALFVRARAYKAMGQTDKAEIDLKRSREVGFDGTKWYSREHLEGEKTK